MTASSPRAILQMEAGQGGWAARDGGQQRSARVRHGIMSHRGKTREEEGRGRFRHLNTEFSGTLQLTEIDGRADRSHGGAVSSNRNDCTRAKGQRGAGS
jgi:hypothetical protein